MNVDRCTQEEDHGEKALEPKKSADVDAEPKENAGPRGPNGFKLLAEDAEANDKEKVGDAAPTKQDDCAQSR